MKLFKTKSGRLFKIALIFTIFCMAVVTIQAVFIKMAMTQVYTIATMEVPEGVQRPEMPNFYQTLIPFLSFSSVITALSGVLIAIAARYGGREVMQQWAEGKKKGGTEPSPVPDTPK